MGISPYYLIPPLPEELSDLAEVGLDLRWSWSHETDALWEMIDPDLWHITRNPWLILQSVSSARLKVLARDPVFKKRVGAYIEKHRLHLAEPVWFAASYASLKLTVAYFSMEFGLSKALPTYSGGLGILAGDYLKAACDLGVPVVGVGLLYQQGYFRQVIDSSGTQLEFYPYNDPSQLPILPVRDQEGEWLKVAVDYPGRSVGFRVWEGRVGRVKLLLLDSNDPANSPADQCITAELYGGGPELRLQQEIALGIGGWRALRATGVDAQICHLNEGHAALAVIERAFAFMEHTGKPFEVALTATRAGNIFTTHTPVEAGFDRFSPALAARYLQGYADRLGIDLDGLLSLGRQVPRNTEEPFNMAYLAIRGSSRVNGVSRLHGEVSRRIFQPLFPSWPRWEVPITHITNGVHMPSWDSAAADTLWTEACGKKRWLGTLDTVERDLKRVPDERLWAFRNEGCRRLIQYAHERSKRQLEAIGAPQQQILATGRSLSPEALTIGFARRFASYKRPTLLLHDPERLARLLQNEGRPLQLIIAGKAHPKDGAGKNLVKAWTDFAGRPDVRGRTLFLADYDMSLAESLVQGVDLWINTPRRPWEASGTSGMKVLVNGGLNLSELDGWWAEAYSPKTGWALGDGRDHGDDSEWDVREAEQLYRLLEEEVIPAFYNRDEGGIPRSWVTRMRLSMAELTPRFSTNRMVREYVERLYVPACMAYRERTADSANKSISIAKWQRRVKEAWHTVHFGKLEQHEGNGHYTFKVPVFSQRLEPENIRVQLYAEPTIEGDEEIHPMKQKDEILGATRGWHFSATLPVRRPAGDYTPRIIPASDGAFVPLEAAQILWYR
jgi:starch phosphorylase